MTVSSFNHVQICAIKTVVPDRFIDIDDELQYFDNNPKKAARAKKNDGIRPPLYRGRKYNRDGYGR